MDIPIADHWFSSEAVDSSTTSLSEPFVDTLIRCNIWYVRGEECDLVVDTGLGICDLRPALGESGRPIVAFATHAHYDHIGGLHEFETRVVHSAEAEALAGPAFATLSIQDVPGDLLELSGEPGALVGGSLLTAYPHIGFDPRSYAPHPTTATRVVDDGDVIELEDRSFEVLHLPGHSPGSAGLWEHETGILYSGDAVYEGALLDEIPGADIPAYVKTMERLRALPVTSVRPGHGPSFGRERLVALCEAYIARRAR